MRLEQSPTQHGDDQVRSLSYIIRAAARAKSPGTTHMNFPFPLLKNTAQPVLLTINRNTTIAEMDTLQVQL